MRNKLIRELEILKGKRDEFDKNIMLKWRKRAIDQENQENKKNNKIGIIVLKNAWQNLSSRSRTW